MSLCFRKHVCSAKICALLAVLQTLSILLVFSQDALQPLDLLGLQRRWNSGNQDNQGSNSLDDNLQKSVDLPYDEDEVLLFLTVPKIKNFIPSRNHDDASSRSSLNHGQYLAEPILISDKKMLFCPIEFNYAVPLLDVLCATKPEVSADISEAAATNRSTATRIQSRTSFLRPATSVFASNVSYANKNSISNTFNEPLGIANVPNGKTPLKYRPCTKSLNLQKADFSNSNFLWSNDSGWQKLVVLRHPFTRFLVAWNTTCNIEAESSNYSNSASLSGVTNSCYDCKQDLGCFIRKHFAYLKRVLTATQVNFVFSDDHKFYPQAWYCNLTQRFAKYTVRIKQHTMTTNIFDKIRLLLCNDSRISIASSELTQEMCHSNDGVLPSVNFEIRNVLEAEMHPSLDLERRFEQLLSNDLHLADLMFKIAYVDFYTFGFKLPKFIQDGCLKATKHYTVCLWF